MSEAHERLRQYLEQRRELGESEFVLDSMSVEDALKLLGARAARPASGSNAAAERTPPASRPSSEIGAAKRRAAEEAATSGDWRAALKATGAEETPTPRKAAPPQSSPSSPFKEVSGPPSSPSPSGPPIVVGANSPGSGRDDLKTFDDVVRAISVCHSCTLSATAKNHVPGEGSLQAKFVCVGEAPGQTEDELGRPFVGKSGELLDKILGAIGFQRSDVYICNVLKHRPPGNRNPAPDEIVACRPFLLRQLELLQPKVILALGTFAAQTLLETDSPIGKLRGLEHRYHGIPLVATYHPAALLRNPNWKRPAWEDVQLARRIFDRA